MGIDNIKESFNILPAYKDNYISVVFSFNDDFSKYFSVALKSLIENSNSEKNYDIVILESEISEVNKKLLLEMIPANFSLRFFNVSEFISNTFNNIKLEKVKGWSVEMYYRIVIPLIMNNYERVLYLDTDIICKKDINELFQIDLEDKELLAVADIFNIVSEVNECKATKDFITNYLKIENIEEYFNSGVLLFNIKKIDINDYLKRMIKAFQIEKTNFPDQDILNLIFKNRVKLISQKWNLQWHLPIFFKKKYLLFNQEKIQEYNDAVKNPFIIHFTSYKKPWENPDEELSFNFWRIARKVDYYEALLFVLYKNNFFKERFSLNLYSKLKENNKVVLWGASLFLEDFLKRYGFFKNVMGIIDKNKAGDALFVHGYKIYSPFQLKELGVNEIILTIVNQQEERYEEIKQYLEENELNYIKLTQI